MRLITDLKPIRLYPKNKKIFIPFDVKNKRKGSAIMLLTPSLESSMRLMQLPYFHNPNYYISYYADRNVNAYLDAGGIVDTSETDDDEEDIQEAVIYKRSNYDTKFIGNTAGGETFLKETDNQFKKYLKTFKISRKQASEFHMYNSFEEYQKDVMLNCKNIPSMMRDARTGKINAVSYSSPYHVYALNYLEWSKVTKESDPYGYQLYLNNEAFCMAMNILNPEVSKRKVTYIAAAYVGSYKYYADRKADLDTDFMACAEAVYIMMQKQPRQAVRIIKDMVMTNNFSYIGQFGLRLKFERIQYLFVTLNEGTLSKEQRKNLKDSDYGLPAKKKYPMPDESHVRAAIRMFNYVDPEDEKELAKNINRKIREFNMTDIKIGDKNRFKKYYKPIEKKKVIKEADNMDDIGNKISSKYRDVLTICDQLTAEEFAFISFNAIYKDAKNIVYRHIEYYGDMPAGFLDLYKIDNAGYIVLAVSPYYRGKGIGTKMVKTLFNSNAAKDNKIDKFMWQVVTINTPSIKLAEKFGFTKEDILDERGRYVYHLYLNPKTKDPLPSNYYVNDVPGEFYSLFDGMDGLDDLQYTLKDIDISQDANSTKEEKEDSTEKTLSTLYKLDDIENNETSNVNTDDILFTLDTIDKAKKNYIPFDVDKYTNESVNMYGNTQRYFVSNEYAIIPGEKGNIISFFDSFNEAAEKKYDNKLRKYLYRERIKNNKQAIAVHNKIKQEVPIIRKTYLTLDRYKNFNIFYDLNHYNALFLKNNVFKLDKGINMYLDFLVRLINNSELSAIYKHQTILIPVDPEEWGAAPGLDMTDFRKHINPISVICRLLKRNPEALKKAFGNKNIIFVGKEGYFYIDFNTFSMAKLNRLKKNIIKLSSGQPIVEGEDDDLDDEIEDTSKENSSAAMTVSMVDKIEKKTGLDLSDVSKAVENPKSSNASSSLNIKNLEITKMNISIPKTSDDYNAVVVLLDPDEKSSARSSVSQAISNIKTIHNYYTP